MQLDFDASIVENYHSNSQKARLLTENWIKTNMYCPRCGNRRLSQFENNRPVADFYCPLCKNEYELKSKSGPLGNKVNDGSYDAMIERITGNRNPDFFFMTYSKTNYAVNDLILIPKHFFVPNMIEKRKPLAMTARRAGWVGCNIVIEKVPEQGKIAIISNGIVADMDTVLKKVDVSNRIVVNDIGGRGWMMDILNCINQLHGIVFTLSDMYAFEEELQMKHPMNGHIRPKIRQQLQILRDRGLLAFLGNGTYRKIV